MRALHRLGGSAEALAVFADHRSALAEELGLDPSPELVEAQRLILERAPDASRPKVVPDTAGDMTSAQDGSPVGLPEAAPAGGGPTTTLIGRDADIEQVRTLTTRHRCLTLVGPGGVGKTSVARAVSATDQVAVVVRPDQRLDRGRRARASRDSAGSGGLPRRYRRGRSASPVADSDRGACPRQLRARAGSRG